VATETLPAAEPAQSPEAIERHWFENVYQGDRMKQLTPRALIMGMALGAFMSLSNVYVGLKAGWGLGVAITSTILAFAIFATLTRFFPKQFPPFSILENNAMASCASAAGYMTGAGVVNAIPALMMLNPQAVPNMWVLTAWVVVISWLGVFLAVPAKRQLINIEKLSYPSGIAAATTMRSLHEHGGEAERQARALGWGAFLGAIITWFRDAVPALGWRIGSFKLDIPATWGTSKLKVGAYAWNQLTMSLEGSLLFVAAGAILGFRQAWSMLLGATVNYLWIAPVMLAAGVIEGPPSFRRITSFSLWIGVPMMVTSGLLLFFMQWKTVMRAFSTITTFFSRRQGGAEDPMDRIEVPGSWFIGGLVVIGFMTVMMGHAFFGIAYWMGVIAVLMTFFLVVVAGRATGETDITPTGPLSKITQLTFGAIKPGDVTTNLMTANITAGACGHAGDLLTDLKSGYLLGAKPRQQFLAQFFGVLAGGLVVIPAFFLLVGDASHLGTEQWPAPAAQVWRGVAELLSHGVGSLKPEARIGLLIGALIGVILPLLEMAFPKHRKFIPSATGAGIAFTVNGYYCISMFIGACIAMWLAKYKSEVNRRYTVPVASGIIAGESLMGVLIAVLVVLKVLPT
jgi:putative OPT family oligopeptide transporter